LCVFDEGVVEARGDGVGVDDDRLHVVRDDHALAYLERNASGARRGKAGKYSIPSSGFIAAAFRHRTSRAGDPLLHTHVLVANLIKGEDGKWGALDARHLYLHAKTAGYLYQAHLRVELTRRLGVEWTPVRKGSADIEGIPRDAIRAFSNRRAEVEALLAERSEPTGREAEIAAVRSRKAKDYDVSPEALLPEWRERADNLGLTAEVLAATLERSRERTAESQEAIARRLADPEGLTGHTSSFTRRDALQGLCSELQDGAVVEEIEAMADAFLASPLVIPLSVRSDGMTADASTRAANGRAPSRAEEPRYTTAGMLSVERDVIERAIDRRLENAGIADPAAVEAALERRPSLFPDQQAMVRRLTTSGLGVEVVVGKAGAGKTFALDAARDAWEASSARVIGCALSARAAQELQSGSGINSSTIATLLADVEHPENGGLAANTVVVVDEAAMVGTRSLERLLQYAERAGAKVVLVGDDRQLPEIDAGGAFRGIKNRLPGVELSEVRRQPLGWERDALDLVREGNAKEAIEEYSKRGRVIVTSSAEETRQRLAPDWWASQDEAEPGVMIAARKSDVQDLNARARRLMRSAGRVANDELAIAGQRFAAGDRVMTLKNSRALGVINGTQAVVCGTDRARCEVIIERADGSQVTLPKGYLEAGHLTHAYAITGHKAQGMTTSRAFVLGDETLYREWGYVAMSRGKEGNHLYVVAGADPEREDLGGEVAPVADPTAELVRALARSRAKDLALDVYEQRDIPDMTMSELRRKWDAFGEAFASAPRDVAAELARVDDEQKRVRAVIQRERNAGAAASRELERMSFLARMTRRSEAAMLRGRIVGHSDARKKLESRLASLEKDSRVLRAGQAAREQWIVANVRDIRTRDAIERELWWREHQQARAADVAMPLYLTHPPGRPTGGPSARPASEENTKSIHIQAPRGNEDQRAGAEGSAAVTERGAKDREKRSAAPASREARATAEHEGDVIERSLEL
jgi:hypothetical protein